MKKQYSFLLLLMFLVLPFSVSAQSSNMNERVGPKIKGFQVGMPIEEAMEVYKKQFNEPLEKSNDGLGYVNKSLTMSFTVDSKIGVVTDFTILERKLKEIFNSPTLDDQFIQDFMDGYQIPELSPTEKSFWGIPTLGYEYIDKSGYTVTMLLGNNGGVFILQVIKSQAFGETKFD